MRALRRVNPTVSVFVVAGLFLICLAVLLSSAQAATETQQYVQMNAGIPLGDNLIALKGKAVTIHVASGQTITGIVKDVRDNMLHLEKISQKDFFDALIRIDLISAVEVRVR